MTIGKRPRIILIVIGAILILGYIGLQVMQQRTKRHSPQETVSHGQDDQYIAVKYCRPYKKGREIFGGLVPYDQVWRTGANEATIFTTARAIQFGGTTVAPGTYTLWTIPGEAQWQVILNSKRYGWGVTWGGVASREAEFDVAQANVPVRPQVPIMEQFTIRFQDAPLRMVLVWDDVRVEVPITAAP